MLRALAGVGGLAAGYAGASRVTDSARQNSLAARHTSTLHAAPAALASDGVAVVANVFSEADLSACLAASACRALPTREVPSTSIWRGSSTGRFHRIDFEAGDVAAFEALERRLLPLVTAFFGDEPAVTTVYRSELQLLTAVPASTDQIWHSDNRSRGLTLVVPLGGEGFTEANGATQLLPGTHLVGGLDTVAGFRALLRDGPCLGRAPRGSVLAYDARLYHRGTGNASSEARPCLVLRYDSKETPPPGVGIPGTFAHATAAMAMHLAAACAVGLR